MNKNFNRVIVIVAFKFCANDAESGIGKKKKGVLEGHTLNKINLILHVILIFYIISKVGDDEKLLCISY